MALSEDKVGKINLFDLGDLPGKSGDKMWFGLLMIFMKRLLLSISRLDRIPGRQLSLH